MATLEDTVRSVVQDFIHDNTLFTALDVSNTVKTTMPQARHREVRDVVRALFCTDIETAGWARTPIQVTLDNGDKAEALLYHPLADLWDLDTKYDTQKRAQTTSQPVAVAAAVVAQAQANATPAVVSAPVVTPVTVVPAVAPIPSPTVPFATARTLWDSMFQKNPSLFPRK